MTNDYAAELRAAQSRFVARTRGLSPRLLRLQMLADSHKSVGFNTGQIDPLEKSFAAQTYAALMAQDELARLEQAHADLAATRDPRHSEGDRLLALKSLADKGDLMKVKLLSIAQQDHGAAAVEAREAYRSRDADVAQIAAIRSAAAARAESAIMDNHTVAGLAAVLVERSQAI